MTRDFRTSERSEVVRSSRKTSEVTIRVLVGVAIVLCSKVSHWLDHLPCQHPQEHIEPAWHQTPPEMVWGCFRNCHFKWNNNGLFIRLFYFIFVCHQKHKNRSFGGNSNAHVFFFRFVATHDKHWMVSHKDHKARRRNIGRFAVCLTKIWFRMKENPKVS